MGKIIPYQSLVVVLGHPVLSPCHGEIYQSSILPRDGGKIYHNMWVYCRHTGYYVQMGHMDPQLSVGERVTPDTVIGYLSNETGWPHNHTAVRRPIGAPRRAQITDNSQFVDMFRPNAQLGGPVLTWGFWLEQSLPQCVKDMVAAGTFSQ